MKCLACKEVLDKRDVRESKILSCWKCGTKRELTNEEKRSLRGEEDLYATLSYNSYTYEG